MSEAVVRDVPCAAFRIARKSEILQFRTAPTACRNRSRICALTEARTTCTGTRYSRFVRSATDRISTNDARFGLPAQSILLHFALSLEDYDVFGHDGTILPPPGVLSNILGDGLISGSSLTELMGFRTFLKVSLDNFGC